MLTKSVSYSAKGAVEYFDDGLSRQDYYSEKGEVLGKWHGLAAKKLGLKGEISREDFVALAKNRLPGSITKENPHGEKLTPRDANGRKVGYDFTLSVPKSVSLAYSLTKDERILKIAQQANKKTMQYLEQLMATQARDGKGKKFYQNTGNMVWATFAHEKSRPVEVTISEGLRDEIKAQYKGQELPKWFDHEKETVISSDPNLHFHNYTFNVTYNKEKNRYQAGEFDEVVKNLKLGETIFHSQLAKGLEEIGYCTERNQHNFDIIGFDKALQDKFSNRRKHIMASVTERGLNSPELRQQAALKTRLGKRRGFDHDLKDKIWWDRITDKEGHNIWSAYRGDFRDMAFENKKEPISEKEALDYAIEYALERKSATNEMELLTLGLKRGMGAVTLEGLQKSIKTHSELQIAIGEKGEEILTTNLAIDEEKALVTAARSGRGQYDAINTDYQIKNELLSSEQQKAVHHALQSKDMITIITGGAGTGKTWSIKEVAQGIKEAGINFHAYAPSSAASRGVQREEGFQNAETLKMLLDIPEMQEQVKDGVIWIDEAGMVGNKTMNQVIDIAKEQNARILLTGDIRQHNSVERGDALRVIQEFGGVKPAYINIIRRQQHEDYRHAVSELSKGDMEKGFDILESFGAIKEKETFTDMTLEAAKEYADAIQKNENTLVVAATHAQGRATTETIRHELKERGVITGKEHLFTIHNNLSLEEAAKKDAINYTKGMSIQFHKGSKKEGIKKGTHFEVVGKDKNGNVLIADENKNQKLLPLQEAKKFSVYHKEQIYLAKGDKIRITQNGKSIFSKRLDNGNDFTVQGFDKNGNIIAKSAKKQITLDQNYRNFTHGYYTTSPSSQGKSVNRVILMQSTSTGKAASKEQFYVSASRGKFAISIYTNDKEFLLKSIQNSSQRQTVSDKAFKPIHQSSTMDKFQKMASIYRVGVSKMSDAWNNHRGKFQNALAITTKLVKPVTHAPVRSK